MALGDALQMTSCIRWTLRGMVLGIAVSTVMLVLYRSSPTFIFSMLMRVDRLAVLAASSATSTVFPGDRIAYGPLTAATFFNFVLVLVTSLQTGVVGACVGLILDHASRAKAE